MKWLMWWIRRSTATERGEIGNQTTLFRYPVDSDRRSCHIPSLVGGLDLDLSSALLQGGAHR